MPDGGTGQPMTPRQATAPVLPLLLLPLPLAVLLLLLPEWLAAVAADASWCDEGTGATATVIAAPPLTTDVAPAIRRASCGSGCGAAATPAATPSPAPRLCAATGSAVASAAPAAGTSLVSGGCW